jgi:hypothetical protein
VLEQLLHIHQHVAPRWSGDANFMPIIGKTKVLPQPLHLTRDEIAAASGSYLIFFDVPFHDIYTDTFFNPQWNRWKKQSGRKKLAPQSF